MITRNDILDAITKCVGYDPVRAPKQSQIIEEAWMKHFGLSGNGGITRLELLAAADTYYASPQRPWPQPGDLSDIAKSSRRDRGLRDETPPGARLLGVRRDKHGYVDKSAADPELPEGWDTWTGDERVKHYWATLESRREGA
jgi:hypothetical protein